MAYNREKLIWVGLRLVEAWIFLWAFFDKLLGFSTPAGQGWINGGSPTFYYLKVVSVGPFSGFYHSIAGTPLVDWIFMLGLLLIGLSLLFGVGMKIAGYAGALLFILMWSAVLPPMQNPIVDEHILQALIFLGFTTVKAGQWFGLGKWWAKTKLVKRVPILE